MEMMQIPEWLLNLDDEDIVFIRNFVLFSGSLKDIASHYNVTYPTVRLRLDRLIQKIQVSQDDSADSYVKLVKKLALDQRIDVDVARILINEYKKEKGD